MQPVRRYIALVAEDFTRNRITVCAHLSNIFNSFSTQYYRDGRMRPPHNMNNFFDQERWQLKYDPVAQEQEGLRKQKTTTNSRLQRIGSSVIEGDTMYNLGSQGSLIHSGPLLMTKSHSTSHVPQQQKAKTSKRIYACFDTNIAQRMFGYRVNFSEGQMQIGIPDPNEDQSHKPIAKFAAEIVAELDRNY